MGWLEDFVTHTQNGEASPTVMQWVGIGTIAGALRRKVWIDEGNFQYTPNFYILLVGPPATHKTTSIRLGTRILEKLDGIEFGPQSATWERLVQRMSEAHKTFDIAGKEFKSCCVTLEIDELGNMLDPTNRSMVDAFTKLWDAPDRWKKETKGNGDDELIHPYLNIMAGATDVWMKDNFNTRLIGSGFASRVVYVNMMEVRRVPHPGLLVDDGFRDRQEALTEQLRVIGDYAGPFRITKQGYEFSSAWYNDWKDSMEKKYSDTEKNLYARSHVHLLKIAMILSASKGKFPTIDLSELEEASAILESVYEDVKKVFWSVGQSPTSKLAKEIIEVLKREGPQTKRLVYRKHFFRTVGYNQFNEAVESAKASGIVQEMGNLSDPVLRMM